MEFVSVGKLVNTHGLKGEVRILSKFRYKDLIFKEGQYIYIGQNKLPFVINNHRLHKNYDMLKLDGINCIEDAEKFKGSVVYINKEDLDLCGRLPLASDLIGYEVFVGDKSVVRVIEIMDNAAGEILVVSDNRTLIPYVNEFVIKINAKKNIIEIKNIGGLI